MGLRPVFVLSSHFFTSVRFLVSQANRNPNFPKFASSSVMLKLLTSTAYSAHHFNPVTRVGSNPVNTPLFKALSQLTGRNRISHQLDRRAFSSERGEAATADSGTEVSSNPSAEDCLTVIALPLLHKPLIPGFYMPIYVKDPKVLAALQESRRLQAPYAGTFLLKDDASTGSSSSSETENILDKLKGKDLLNRIHEVGTLAQISSIQGEQVILIGRRRLQITKMLSEDPLTVKVDHLKDKPYDKDDDVIKATYFEVISTLADVLKTTSLWRDQVQTYSQHIGDFNYQNIADFGVGISSANKHQNQGVLEEVDVHKRLELTLELMKKQVEINKIQESIAKTVEEKFSGERRRILLKERLKATKKELGWETDDKSTNLQRRQSSFLDCISVSVVKVFSIARITDSLHPWRFSDVEEGNGSGFVISGRRIITNAHVVTGSTYVQITKLGSGTKYKASIQAFGHSCDLAVLVVDNEEFWKDLKPLDILSEMPRLFQTVRVVGYPQGGDSISITSGVVSRIVTSFYSHSKTPTKLPAFQVDAAINNGNSGGPVFIGKSVAGIAFEGLDECQNIGYVIPSPILLLFLRSIEKNKGVGSFCSLGLSTQPMENKMMRDYFGMEEKMTGVVVTRVEYVGRPQTIIENDVLLAVDGNPIQNDGEVSIGIDLEGFIALKTPSEEVSFDLLREGIASNITFTLANMDNSQDGKDYPPPSYLIFGGFVFTNTEHGFVKISQVLEDDLNIGYTSFRDSMVMKVNGVDMYNVKGMRKMIEKAKRCSITTCLRLQLDCGSVVILNLKSVAEAEDQVLEFQKVFSATSHDMRTSEEDEDEDEYEDDDDDEDED